MNQIKKKIQKIKFFLKQKDKWGLRTKYSLGLENGQFYKIKQILKMS